MTRTKLLMGASALVAAATAMAGAASAVASPTQIYGGGSTLIAPYLRQAEDCYGNQVPLVAEGTVHSGPSANETTTTLNYFNYTGAPAHNCSSGPVNSAFTYNYMSSGSGAGINSFYSHDPVAFWGDTIPGVDPSYYASVHYAASDAGLSGTDIGIYLNGGTEGSVVVTAPGVAPVGSQYANPYQQFGNPIELPVLVAPVAIAYNSVYKYTVSSGAITNAYHFNVHKPNKDGSGGLLLDVSTVCAIFNGQITNWNDPALKYLNGNNSLEDPADPTPPASWSVPIEIVGRQDGSGTTSIFYRAMAAQCTGSDTDGGDSIAYTNQYAAAGSKNVPKTLAGPSWDPTAGYVAGANGVSVVTPGLYTTATGNGGIAKYLANDHGASSIPDGNYTNGQIAYLGPDYALPAVTITGANTYALNVADIKVGTVGIEPTGANALKAFGTGANILTPPQSTSTGAYSPTALGHGQRSAPQDWVEPISTTTMLSTGPTFNTPLANPNVNIAGVTKAYPFVGTTDMFVYTCYADPTVASGMTNFLTYYFTQNLVTKAKTGLLAINGFAAMPKAWATAIVQSFITPTTTGTAPTNALNLNILQAGTGPATGTGSQCHAATPGA